MPATALLVVDMLNPYDHEDADKLAESVRETLPRIVELRDRAQENDDVLLVYANDNYERWDSTRDDLVEGALAVAGAAATTAATIAAPTIPLRMNPPLP